MSAFTTRHRRFGDRVTVPALLVNLVILVVCATLVTSDIGENAGEHFCTYNVRHLVCVEHLHQQSNTTAPSCDRLAGQLVVHYLPDGLELWAEPRLDWNDQPLDGPLHLRALKTKEGLVYQAKRQSMPSGFHTDLMAGLAGLFLNVTISTPEADFGSCVKEESSAGVEGAYTTTKTCRKTSKLDNIYYIEEYRTERQTTVEAKLVASMQVEETFQRYSNLHTRIGEKVSTTTHLSKLSCKTHGPTDTGDATDWDDIRPAAASDRYKSEEASTTTIGQIIKEADVLKLSRQLVTHLKPLDQAELEKLLNKFDRHARLDSIVQSCGSLGTLRAFRAVTSTLSPSGRRVAILEKFLVALSFHPDPEDEIVDQLPTLLEKYKKSPDLVETTFLCLCKLTSRKNKSFEQLDGVLRLVGGVGGCQSEDTTCQRRLLLCVSAMQTDQFSDRVSQILVSAQDKKIRELAAATLALPNCVSSPDRVAVQEKAWQAILTQRLANEQFAKLLELVDLSYVNGSTVNQLLQTKDKERKAYLAQKLASCNAKFQKDYSLLSHSTQGESVYLLGRTPPSSTTADRMGGVAGGFSFSTSMSGGALSRSAFDLWLHDSVQHTKQLLTIHSYVGGLSGMVATQHPEDDAEANASLQIYLLGLPLRPFHLFSSMGDLIDFYWSGAGQEKTTLLQGVVPLEKTDKEWHTALGVRVKIQSDLSLHVHTQGEGSISIWDSSGSSSLHTAIQLHGFSKLNVVAPGAIGSSAPGAIGSAGFLSTSLNLNTAIQADTQVRLGTSVKACVIMSSDKVELEVELRGRDLASSHLVSLPGFTINLNKKNNNICSSFAK